MAVSVDWRIQHEYSTKGSRQGFFRPDYLASFCDHGRWLQKRRGPDGPVRDDGPRIDSETSKTIDCLPASEFCAKLHFSEYNILIQSHLKPPGVGSGQLWARNKIVFSSSIASYLFVKTPRNGLFAPTQLLFVAALPFARPNSTFFHGWGYPIVTTVTASREFWAPLVHLFGAQRWAEFNGDHGQEWRTSTRAPREEKTTYRIESEEHLKMLRFQMFSSAPRSCFAFWSLGWSLTMRALPGQKDWQRGWQGGKWTQDSNSNKIEPDQLTTLLPVCWLRMIKAHKTP